MRRDGAPGYAPNAGVPRDVSTNVNCRVATGCVAPTSIGVTGVGGGGGGGRHPTATIAITAMPIAAPGRRPGADRRRNRRGDREGVVEGTRPRCYRDAVYRSSGATRP